MAKRIVLPTRGFGAEPGLPDIAGLAGWIADHRGRTADLTTYLLETSLSPQISAGIALPCAGGTFYRDRVRTCILGLSGNRAVGELHADTSMVTVDAAGITLQAKGVWYAIPAPHQLGIRDFFYHDPDELHEAVCGSYRSILRAMRDAGIAGNVVIADRADDAEISSLARQKVLFFVPAPGREDLETLLEHQRQAAVTKDQLETVFELRDCYNIRRIFLTDPDPLSIRMALSQFDPDQVSAAGYCTGGCETYWRNIRWSAEYAG